MVIGLTQPEGPNTDAHGFPRMNTNAPRPIRPADPGSRGRRGDALGSVLGRPRDPRGRATRPRGGRVRRPVPAKTWPVTSSVCIRVYPWNIFRTPWVAAFVWEASSGFQGLLVWRSQADNKERMNLDLAQGNGQLAAKKPDNRPPFHAGGFDVSPSFQAQQQADPFIRIKDQIFRHSCGFVTPAFSDGVFVRRAGAEDFYD